MTQLERQCRRDFEAILRPSRWADGIQVIGAVPEYVVRQLGIATRARSVWLHEQTVMHLCDRPTGTPHDSEFVLEYLPAAVMRPMFCARAERGAITRLHLVEHIREAHRYLFVALKVVPAERGDELWVSTAFPMNEEALRRELRRCRLQPVIGERTLEGGKTRTARRSLEIATQMP